jgi:hypothetical protein
MKQIVCEMCGGKELIKLRITALFVALAAVFSFSQEDAERDSSEVSSCFLMQAGEDCPSESYVNSDGDTLCCIQESDGSKSN